MIRLLAACTLLAFLLLSSSPSAQGPVAIPADRLADSVGVNVHLHHLDTLYGNFPAVQWFLGQLGVRHVRDGLIDTSWQGYYDRHNALGTMGIKGIFIATPTVTDAVLRSYPSRMSYSFEGYELPNELDASGSATWTGTLLQSLTQLHGLDVDPALTQFPVIGPSLTSAASYAALGDVSGFYDAGNVHDYLSGRNPGTWGWGADGYGSIDWNLRLANHYAPGKPIIATETGYTDDPAVVNSIPSLIAGRYLPRLVLEQFRNGITRTYIYELLDFPTTGLQQLSGYGLVATNGAWKPAFHALRNLLRLFSDPGPAPAAASLDYVLTGGDPTVRQMLFQKRDGTFLLALWQETSTYDTDRKTYTPVAPTAVHVHVPVTAPFMRSYQWRDGGVVEEGSAFAGQTSFTVIVSDSLLVLQFGA